MTEQQISFDDVCNGPVPAELTGVRWADGLVQCRANVTSSDYRVRTRSNGRTPAEPGLVLTDPSVTCDLCAEKC